MSTTMARQGGGVQLEQSDMRLALYVVKIAQGGFSQTAIEWTQYLFKQPRAEVQEEKKQGVVFLGHKQVKAAIDRYPAMIIEYLTDCCLPCQNGTAQNPQSCWRRNGTGAPWPEQTPSPPGMPPVTPAPPSDNEGAEIPEIDVVPPKDVYIHSPLLNAKFFNHEAFAKVHKLDQDFIPDLPTDEETTTG